MKKIKIILILFFIINSPIFGQISKDSLFVFTGKRVSIKKVEDFVVNKTYIDTVKIYDSIVLVEIPNVIQDYKYKSKFKIVEQFKGNIKGEQIEFELYNHYGKPKFPKSNVYLLFIIKLNGEFQLLKYAHHQVYESKKGKFIVPFDQNEYRNQQKPLLGIKPEKFNFKKTPKIKIYKNDSKDWIKSTYPKPYYRIEKKRAIPIYGNYIKDYIELRLNGTLNEVFKEI